MSKYDDFYFAIDEIKDCIKKDLYGVSSEREVLDDVEPLAAYVTGILYPRKATQAYEDSRSLTYFDAGDDEFRAEEEIAIENALDGGDDTITGANRYKPSSIGISVMVSSEVRELSIVFECGTYKFSEERAETISRKYTRSPQRLDLLFNVPNRVGTERQRNTEGYEAEINLTVRKIMADGSKLVTVSAVNTAVEKNELHIRNEYALFQCRLSVKSGTAFLPIYQNLYSNADVESQIMALLYRTVKNYGYGHGCSVAYEETPEGVFEISSEFIPTEQVLQMMPGDIKNKNILLLQNLKKAGRETVCSGIHELISEYSSWKDAQEKEAEKIHGFEAAAKELLKRIEACLGRLKNGVKALREDDSAWRAFQLMNEAMLLQRVNTKHQNPDTISWYPFQLAYILQIIPDIVDEKSEYRNATDLLWFPTGGGKTEAYLGVAAFAIFYRRLAERPDEDGVAVIMRYTLRLLTIQQFERAAALVCACEYLRKTSKIPGGEISIGLWIGSGMTPNHVDDARDILNKLRENKDEKIYEGNPVQITACPWCGTPIDITGYSVDTNGLTICCRNNPACEFHAKLPIYVVDEDIYRQRPTLLLSTIDKFARIAWVEETRNLFGVGEIPPSLIIQDELHLISGSLGSLAGVYEIAVDYLCRRNGVLAKRIASTATVKNAAEQINHLYHTKMVQFPPSGVSLEDSFFAHMAGKDERPARTYVGICENGGSIADLLVRTYAVLTFVKALFERQGKPRAVIDQYYTIIGYFNAIRDLGASSNILQDRMYTHIRSLIRRKFRVLCGDLGLTEKDIRFFHAEELTSRKSAKEIKETLEHLEIPCDRAGCYSYVLASNMLSVGIDINRLGLMTVYNQPKTNAEYIQATSRVGRQDPGLVLAMYHPMRSRDKSHYEQFGFYHKSFYQYVEATSVTPFSARALEKALPCVFIALVRLTIPRLGGNESPVFFNGGDKEVQKIKKFILERVEDTREKSLADAEYLLDELISAWERQTMIYPDLCYVSKERPCLLHSAEAGAELDFPVILNSLRNVEESANVYVK